MFWPYTLVIFREIRGQRLWQLVIHNWYTIYKKQNNLIRGLGIPWGFQKFAAPRFQDNRHIKVVRLLALRIGHLYPLKIFLVLISVRC